MGDDFTYGNVATSAYAATVLRDPLSTRLFQVLYTGAPRSNRQHLATWWALADWCSLPLAHSPPCLFQLWLRNHEAYWVDLTSRGATTNVHWPDFATDWLWLLKGSLLADAIALPPRYRHTARMVLAGWY